MSKDRIVSIGLLSEDDLERLGKGFTRHFPVPTDDAFADLVAQLHQIDVPLQSEAPTPVATSKARLTEQQAP